MSELETGRQRLNRQLVEGAASFAGPAADLARGASLMETASNALKGALLDKLLGPTALFAGSLVGVLRTVRAVVRESGILEKGMKRIATVQGLSGKFETLLRSATAAKAKIEELYRFTANSPFDFQDVARAALELEKLTKGAFTGTRALEMVGDAAAATGNSASEMAHVIGRLYDALSRGRSIDRLLFQFQGTGVVTDELAAKLAALEASGASFSSKWSEVEKVLARTSGAMRNEMETLDALKTRLDQANARFAQAFAEPYLDAQVQAMKAMIAATENLTPVVAEIGRDFAVLPNFIRDAKNSLLDTVAASRGFADALRVAYRIAVSLFVGLAGATLVAAARNLAGLGSATLATASAMRAGYSAALAAAKAQAGLALATELSTAATKAFAAGSMLSAATLKVESLWIAAKTRALAANAAAARLAGAGTSAYSVASHVAGLAVAGLGGAVKIAAKGLGLLLGLVRGAAVAFVTNPWTAAAAAVLTFAAGLYKWGTAARQAAQDARELADSIRDTNKQLSEQSAAVKTLTDWQTQVERLRQKYDEATAAVVAFHKKVESGEEPTREEINANARNVRNRVAYRDALEKELRRNTSGLGLSDAETEAIRADQAQRRAASDRDFRISYANAETPEAKLAVLESRKADLANRVRDGRAAKAAEFSALRNGESAARVRLEQKAADIRAKYDQRAGMIEVKRDKAMEGAGPVTRSNLQTRADEDLRALAKRRAAELDPVEAQIRRIGLKSKSPTARAQARLDEALRTGAGPAEVERLTRALEDAKAAVAGLADAENELAEVSAQLEQDGRDMLRARVALSVSNQFDARIATARRAGLPAGGLEFDKALSLAEVKRSDARTPDEKQAAQNEIDALKAEREAGRRDVLRERARNSALARGDRKGAAALEDAAAMQAQRERYASLGFSAKEADADFRAAALEDAAEKTPGTVSSSLASIGGGGGVFQGRDPLAAAMERAQRAQEQTARETAASAALLREIRDGMKDDD